MTVTPGSTDDVYTTDGHRYLDDENLERDDLKPGTIDHQSYQIHLQLFLVTFTSFSEKCVLSCLQFQENLVVTE